MTDEHGFVFGEVCQSAHSAPARYIGHGLCLYISAMDNDKQVTSARKAPPDMWAGVIPTMEMVEAASAGVHHIQTALAAAVARAVRCEAAMQGAISPMEKAPDAENTFSAWLNLRAAIGVLNAALTPPDAGGAKEQE